jgi:uncharacterized protein (TIGR01732 family)
LSNHTFVIKNIIVMRLNVSSSNTIEVVKNMSGYGGYGMPSYGGAGFNFALIVVLFILLIIVLASVV